MVHEKMEELSFCVSFDDLFYADLMDLMTLAANTTDINTSEANISLETGSPVSGSEGISRSGAKYEWFQIVIPILSGIGIVGNILNLILLTRRRLLSSMERLERAATYGLVALAVSDMMFCISIFPHMFITQERHVTGGSRVLELYYKVYGISFINLFMMISTWLITVISVSRYLVVVYPIQMRHRLNGSKVLISIVSVFIFSVIVSLPLFLHLIVVRCQTFEGDILYEIQPIPQQEWADKLRFYIRWIWPIFADFIPIIILAFCNARLIRQLKKAASLRRSNLHSNTKEGGHRVSLTLVIIVLLLLLFVSPPEILKYINPYQAWGDAGIVVASIANVLQALVFAINFFLYCVLNPYFRQTMLSLLCCCCRQREPISGDITEQPRSLFGGESSGEKFTRVAVETYV